MSAMDDAFRDMQAEDCDLIKCYFGSAYIHSDDADSVVGGINLLIKDATSYEEAVGMAYLQLKHDFSYEEGYEIENLEMERLPVFVDRDSFDEWDDGGNDDDIIQFDKN